MLRLLPVIVILKRRLLLFYFIAIVGMEKPSGNQLTLKWETVQKQTNSSECGLLAVAFLVEILFHGDPSKVMFRFFLGNV